MTDDLITQFIERFEPYRDGYLYYPSKRTGGRFVTTSEFEKLKTNWTRVAGWRGMWTMVGVICALCFGLLALQEWADLPGWASRAATFVIAMGVVARIGWASFEPNRLVRGRPDITPLKSNVRRR